MSMTLEDTRKIRRRVIAFLALVAVVAVTAYALNFAGRPPSPDPEQWGQFGDYVGGILNSTIALCALYALLHATSLQHLELTKMKAAVDEQIFDGRFYNALSQYNESLKSVRYTMGSRESIGYEALRDWLHDLLYKTSDFATPLMKFGRQGFPAEFFPLIGGHMDHYLGTSTPMMIVRRIINIADMIERGPAERRAFYHQQFTVYLSLETRVWVYITFLFTKRQGTLPPEYGCLGTFLEYMNDNAARDLKIERQALTFIATQVRKMVDRANARAPTQGK